jgi:hypothetical protein
MDTDATVKSIGDAIAALDEKLQSGNPPINSDQWNQLNASEEHLADQQQALVLKDIQADDATVQAAATDLDTATKTLQADIKKEGTIDTIISDASTVSAAADTILKIV